MSKALNKTLNRQKRYQGNPSLLLNFIIPAILISGLSLYYSDSYSQHYRLPPNLPKYDRNLYHFGFILGINGMNYSISNNKDIQQFDSLRVIESESQLGFTIGIVSNLRLGWDYADLRFVPSLSFGEERLIYTIHGTYHPKATEIKPTEVTKLEFPLSIKLKSERFANNVRAYVLAGVRYSIDLASQAKQKEATDVYVIRLKRNDYAYEFGTGFDFYLTYFKFGIDLRMIYGVRDLLKRDNTFYTKSINKLNSKMFLLSFTFE
jgi:hypothetical protein